MQTAATHAGQGGGSGRPLARAHCLLALAASKISHTASAISGPMPAGAACGAAWQQGEVPSTGARATAWQLLQHQRLATNVA